MIRFDAAIARLGVRLDHTLAAVNRFESKVDMRTFMPWPREEVVPPTGDQLLEMVKRMGIKHRKPN